MNASTPGISVPSTKAPSRAERRAEAERIRHEQASPAVPETAKSTPAPDPAAVTAESPGPAGKDKTIPTPPPPTVQLPMKARHNKRPLATQVQASTLGRLEWVRRQGAVLTDTVDAAINAYLDAAGVPHADENGNITE
ncbi:hypothetical protein AB0H00_29540 [Nocardia sp. NPDC023852]|uniref:hypothetical protein n=1 Tax=Nocardia sp. NPDC023852 TaxID=3154697 RepID=UPI0033FFEF79